MTPDEKKVLMMEYQRLQADLVPATAEEIMTALGKLVIHYPQMNMGDNQLKSLYEDYLDDLAPYPAWAMFDACKAYRREPRNEFFPKVSVLLTEVKRLTFDLRRKCNVICNILDEAPYNEESRGEIKASDWEKLKKQLAKDLTQ